MGLGDEIMVTALLKKLHVKEPTWIVDNSFQPRWHPAWEHNPLIKRYNIGKPKPDPKNDTYIMNCPGHRHYIMADNSFLPWGIIPGEIFLTDKEKSMYQLLSSHNYIYVDPDAKNPNKDWGWYKYKDVIEALPGYTFVQPMWNHKCKKIDLPNVQHITIHNIRQFFSVVYSATAVLCSEGGVHHTAAAFNKPGVVIFGSFINPKVTGYDMHTNLSHGISNCARNIRCLHCRRGLDAIQTEVVIQSLSNIMKGLGYNAKLF